MKKESTNTGMNTMPHGPMVGDLPTCIQQKSKISLWATIVTIWSIWDMLPRSTRFSTGIPSHLQCFACQVSKHTERETSGLSVERLIIIHWGKRGHHVMRFPHCHPGDDLRNRWRPVQPGITGWWYTYHLEKYESQWEGLSHI